MKKKMMVQNKISLLLIALTFLFSSCNRNVVYTEYHTFPNNEWNAKEKVVFDVDIKDNQNLHNISLKVRHTDSYPFSNLYMFVTTAYPDGMVKRDTMEVILSNQKGEWKGSGAGDIFDFKVPIKKNVRFALPGKYQFTFEHAMRVDPLPQIMDFGFEIEKSN